MLFMRGFTLSFAGVALLSCLVGCGSSKPADSGVGGTGGATSASGVGGNGGGTGGTTSASGVGGTGGGTGGTTSASGVGGTGGSTGGTTAASGGGGSGGATLAPDAGPGPGSGGSADFENRYINAFCQFFARCGVSPSVAACKADYFDSGAVNLTVLVQDIDSGKIIYDVSQALACFDAIAATACTEEATVEGGQTNALCTTVIRGTVAVGGNCVTDAECVGGVCHQPSCGSSCCLGTCGQPLAAGEACTSSTDCVPGDYCGTDYVTSSQSTCQPQGAQGQPCTYNSECQSGLTCDSAGSGTCAPYVKDGQPCNPDGADCENVNGFCDTTSGTCRPRLAVGAACSVPDGGISRISSGCVVYADCREGTCVALPGPGEACTVLDGGYAELACFVGTCTNGTCQGMANPACTVASATSPDAGARD